MAAVIHDSCYSKRTRVVLCIAALAFAQSTAARAEEPTLPILGAEAREFELSDLRGKVHRLSDFTRNGPAVLLVLRGYPGYQCPICSRQAGQYIAAIGGCLDLRCDTKASHAFGDPITSNPGHLRPYAADTGRPALSFRPLQWAFGRRVQFVLWLRGRGRPA